MPVPSSIADLSATPASNSPAGSETPSSTDDYLRTGFAFIKQTYDATQSGSTTWCDTSGGTANALTLTPAPAITAYAAGQVFRFKAAITNTGPVTVSVSGLSPIAIQVGGAACAGGEIVANQWYEILLSSATVAQLRTALMPNLTTALNTKRATVAATATTTPLWTPSNGNIQDWTGTPTITDFPAAPQAGSQREVYPAVGTSVTNGGNIAVQGGAKYTVSAGDRLTITAVTTTTFYVAITKRDGSSVMPPPSKIQPLSASVSSNALTITLSPTVLDFRSSTLGSGTVNTRTVSSAISLVISSGSTLGFASGALSRIIVFAIDNAGTVELAAMNVSSACYLDETGLISTTAEGGVGGADSASVMYSTAARSNVSYRIVGYIESTQTTAGTWANAPSTIQGAGGLALTAMSSLGYFGTWVNATASRALSTTYTNSSTNKPMMVIVCASNALSGSPAALQGLVDGLAISQDQANDNTGASYIPRTASVYMIVPPGSSYRANWGAGSGTLIGWYELR